MRLDEFELRKSHLECLDVVAVAARFDPHHFSKKIAWSRYDIDTSRLLPAEWLVPNFPRAASGTSPKLQWLGGEPLEEDR